MRFVQFLRGKDCRKYFGIISEDGKTLLPISTENDGPTDMLTFISQSKDLSADQIQDKIKLQSRENIDKNITLLPPITNPEKIVCIGLNYLDHCQEQNLQKPKEPMFFSKFASTIVGPNGNVIAHQETKKIDWEVELAVIIGKESKKVPKEKALDYVFGYSVAQDISARDWQKERNGGQFLIGKSMDTFCPIGPSIVHKSLVKDVHNLQISTKINGVQKQNGNTKNMIYNVNDIIYNLTKNITLKPGDIILTGTPAGVGMHRNPPEFLKPGDIIESEIESIGKLVNKVVDA